MTKRRKTSGRDLAKTGVLIAGTAVALTVAVIAGWKAYVWTRGDAKLSAIRPPVCVEVHDRNDDVIDYACPFDGIRVWRSLGDISPRLKSLVIMLEDDKFYEHGGLDIDGIWNAIETDIEKKKLARGGSTITQQLAKNLFLTKEKTLLRKASEVPLAIRLEQELSKDRILELYLNTIEWGPGVYGAEAASRLYFDQNAKDLREEQAWLLALMIPNPRELNLWVAPRAKKSLLNRARHLSNRLYLEHHMSKPAAHAALERFNIFLEEWSSARPNVHSMRRYPERWAMAKVFFPTSLASFKRQIGAAAKRSPKSPVKTHFDRTIQARLAEVADGATSPTGSETTSLVVLAEDPVNPDGQTGLVRAALPLPGEHAAAEISPAITALASELGLQALIVPAKKVHSAAWLR